MRRISRMTLEIPLDSKQLALLGTYFYHSNAADGSGEFALRFLLGPGAYAYNPIGDRLIDAARRDASDPLRLVCPVTFIYGATHDWMSASAGDAVAEALKAAGVSSSVHRVGPAGHHVYLEAASLVNAVLTVEVGAAVARLSSSYTAPLEPEPPLALLASLDP